MAALQFSYNENILERSDPMYDRAFKIRPLIDHFNTAFQAAREQSKEQSIEHIVKFKGHSAKKQYIKTNKIGVQNVV